MTHVVEDRDVHRTSVDAFAAYQPEQCVFFSTKDRQLLAAPPFAALLEPKDGDICAQVEESLRFAEELGLDNACVVGALPFDVKEQSYLRLSNSIVSVPMKNKVLRKTADTCIGECTIQEVTNKQHFTDAVEQAKIYCKKGILNKVVLSRAVDVQCQFQPDIKALVNNLDAKNTHGYTFAVPLQTGSEASVQSRRTLIGASPELLLSKSGSRVFANPLAGSEPRSDDPEIDQQRAQRLLQSNKDRYEHDLVIKAIEKALRPFCRWLHVPKEPSLMSTATMWHLGTRIEGELFDPNISSLRLAMALHPTPAVGGHPQQRAQQVINELEHYDRDLFTGMVGWTNHKGDGEWAVTIRCAIVADKSVRLYAGAGIVAESIAEKELAETEAKLNTMLGAIGVTNENASLWEA